MRYFRDTDDYDEPDSRSNRNFRGTGGKILSLRIGSGFMAGRKLLPPPTNDTRPMTGYAKKSLFSILRQRIENAVVLDLYCGTGTLGMEAISNGAAMVCFAEQNRRVVERLRQNIEALQVSDISRVWEGNLEMRLPDWLAKLNYKVDVAFVDPPYASARSWDLDLIESRIFSPLAGSLADDGVILLRLPDDVPLPEKIGGLELNRTREYGSMKVGFYARKENVNV
ncbi:MAG TPA: 16S rRNA (guanine(966)-N(2))-methyltransferase RsmD [Phycisphaerae bacterium]|nr:16S rRNA (guanine(966)-N(2))-methyltransferase RsmD [Phycisphaerae bacterium]HPS52692.1 16S rRNA (guanine(966)-N(2))-methyltransferase RsmD [Phycisphaerae bacterium]